MKPTLPTYDVYANYSNKNYGVHALCFTDPQGNRFWFSYTTLVAFDAPEGVVVHENDWGPTTGKHLNAIDDGEKKKRLSDAAFQQRFREVYRVHVEQDDAA